MTDRRKSHALASTLDPATHSMLDRITPREAWLKSTRAQSFSDPLAAATLYDRFRAACAEVASGRWIGEITVGGNPE